MAICSTSPICRWLLTLLGITAIVGGAHAYDPPAGIPEPVWGDLHPIETDAPAWPEAWPALEATDFYYVDSSHPDATDRNNRFGYPDRPRATIPEIRYAPGSYVEIHGGPYRGSGQIIFTAGGTEDAPVWFRGGNSDAKAVIHGEMIVKGEYVFIENLRFNTNRTLGLRPHRDSSVKHAVVRYCLFDGPGEDVGNHAAIAISGRPGERRNSDIVVYRNQIRDFGDRDSPSENDFHGIAIGVNADRIWILDNDVSNLGGDSVQVGTTSARDQIRASHIYIGGNRFHDNRENAIDIKRADNVVVSENEMSGFSVTDSSTGAAVVVHNGPTNVWLLNNSISRSNHGFLNTGGTNVWLISNLFFDIFPETERASRQGLYAGGSILHFRGVSSGGIVNNTFSNYRTGLQLAKGTRGYTVVNNVFSGRRDPEGFDVIAPDRDVASNSDIQRNAFVGGARIQLRDRTYDTGRSKQAFSDACRDCLLLDGSLFVDEDGGDFGLQPSSPAIDAGMSIVDVHDFEALYGIELTTDHAGSERIVGADIDIGAFEWHAETSAPAEPAASSRLE